MISRVFAAVVCALLTLPSLLRAQSIWSVRLDADAPAIEEIGFAILVGSDALVYDQGAARIVRLDRTGKVTQRIGAKGSGPGEFRSVSWMGVGVGDSLYTWDGVQRRLSVFAPNGRYVRAESPEHGLQHPGVFGRLRDGRWLVVTHTQRESRVGGVDIEQTILHVGIARSVRIQPVQVAESPSKTMVGIKSGEIYQFRELPAMDMGYLAACENGFLVGSGAQREVRAYDPAGKLLGVIRALRVPMLVDAGTRKRSIESWAGVTRSSGSPPTDPTTAAAFAEAFDAAIPTKMHFTEQFVFGGDRSVWIAPNLGYNQWQMLGADGVGKPELALGKGLHVVATSAEYVLARDYGDNERLELWPKPAAFRGKSSGVPASLGTCTSALVQ